MTKMKIDSNIIVEAKTVFNSMENKDKLDYLFILYSMDLQSKGFDILSNIKEYKENCT